MPERPTVHASLRLASAATVEKRRRLKCDRDVKLHLPEALYDDLARQARADSRAHRGRRSGGLAPVVQPQGGPRARTHPA